MDSTVREFIDKTGIVFKLQIVLCNCQLKVARLDGNLNHAKKMLTKQTELAEQFRKWKHDIKNYYDGTEITQEVLKKLQSKIQHAEKEAERICDLIEQGEKALRKKANSQLSETLNGDKSFSQRSPYAKPERTNDKYPLKQEEYNTRMSIPLEEHLKFARSYSRIENTSEKADITDRNVEDPLFSFTWEDFTLLFVAENRKQHEADRLIENTIFRFIHYYWKTIEPFANSGLVVPDDFRSCWESRSEWVKKRLGELDRLIFEPHPLPKKLEETMHSYIRFINDAVIDAIGQILRSGFFDAFRTIKISEFCGQPTLELLKEVIIDEITKDYGLFNTRQIAEHNSNYERKRNEPSPSLNKWMLTRVRVLHEIAKQNE